MPVVGIFNNGNVYLAHGSVFALSSTSPESGQDSMQEKRESVAAGLSEIFRRHYLNASATAVNNELVVSVTGASQAQRDRFLSEYFPRKTQEGLCAIGFNKLLVTGGGFFSGSEEYRIRCKGDSSETANDAGSKSEKRKAFAESLKRTLAVSPKIESVEVNGTTLDIVGKNGLDAKAISSTFVSVMGTNFKLSACKIGFVGIRFKRTVSDKGIYSSLNCNR